MICSRCQGDNRAGRRFCGGCGAALPLPCAACGFGNEAGERFCGGCGVPVGDAPPPVVPAAVPAPVVAPPAQAPAGPAAEGGAQRRHLTVLFCDVVGSTEMSTRLDAEDLDELIRGFQERTAATVARHHGFVARYMGDGVLVYFGYPQAHEDDAEQAVRAALEIQASIEQMGAAVRIGIATGPTVIGDLIGKGASEERPAVGETPNLAARLQGLARPGSVVVAEVTRRLCGEAFEFEDLGQHALKGFAAPVGAFRAVRAREGRSRFESRAAARILPMVGRDRELGLLADRWASAVAGEGQVVLLTAEAGFGKSRLLVALEERIAAEPGEFASIHVQGLSHRQASTLRPFVDWLIGAAGVRPEDSPEQRRARIEDAVRAKCRADRVPYLLALVEADDVAPSDPGMTAEKRREATLAALLGQIVDASTDRPLLVVLEDAQWFDPTSLALLERLVVVAAEGRRLIAVTGRPELEPRWAGRPHVTQLKLNRLSTSASTDLLTGVAEGRTLPREVLDDILRRTDGIPLFVEEMGRAVLDSGSMTVPATLRESLLARLDRLPASRDIAQAASVIGREFTAELLAAAAGHSPAAVRAALAQLGEAGVVLDQGEGRFSFKHALVRDIAYESLLKRPRRALHEAIARSLETSGAGARQPEVIGHHLAESGRGAEAATLFLEAARRAERQASFAEAVLHLKRALEGLGPAEEADDAAASFRIGVELDLAAALRVIDRLDEALQAVDRAQKLAQKLDHAESLSRAYFTRGNLCFLLVQSAECERWHGEALREARRAGSVLAEVRALGGLGDAAYAVGAVSTARERFDSCVALASQHGFLDIEADNLPMLASTTLWLMEIGAGRAAAERAVAAAVARSRIRGEIVARNYLAMACRLQGDIAGSVSATEPLLDLARRLGARMFEGLAGYARARALEASGEREPARALVEQTLASLPEGRVSGLFLLPLLAMKARLSRDPAALAAVVDREKRAGAWTFARIYLAEEGLESARALEEWDAFDTLTGLLRATRPAEPVPLADYYVGYHSALARARRGPRDAATREALTAVRQRAAALGAIGHLPTLDDALALFE